MNIIEITEFSFENFQVVQNFVKVLTPGANNVLTETGFREIIGSANSHLFFIAEEHCVAGMLTVGIYNSPTGTKAWIEDVVVDGVYRGRGLGKMLVLHAINYAKSLGVCSLMLTSNPSRVAANKLYLALGFERKETNVYRMTWEK